MRHCILERESRERAIILSCAIDGTAEDGGGDGEDKEEDKLNPLPKVRALYKISNSKCCCQASMGRMILGRCFMKILSMIFTDRFNRSQSDARILVAYNSCQH